MTNVLRSAIKDREVWPDEALVDLMRRIDQEIERRSEQGPGAAEEQQRDEGEALEALERGTAWGGPALFPGWSRHPRVKSHAASC